MQARSVLSRLESETSMAATIRLRTRQLAKFARLKGWATDDAVATALGLHPATVSRVLRGKTAPGERFIAAVLSALPEVEFGDLFEVVAESDAA